MQQYVYFGEIIIIRILPITKQLLKTNNIRQSSPSILMPVIRIYYIETMISFYH